MLIPKGNVLLDMKIGFASYFPHFCTKVLVRQLYSHRLLITFNSNVNIDLNHILD